LAIAVLEKKETLGERGRVGRRPAETEPCTIRGKYKVLVLGKKGFQNSLTAGSRGSGRGEGGGVEKKKV